MGTTRHKINGKGKMMVVTPSRLAAVKYTQAIREYIKNNSELTEAELEKLKWAIKIKKNERSMYIQKFILPDAKISYEYQNLMGREYGANLAGPIPGMVTTGAGAGGNTATMLPLFAMHSSPSYSKFGIYA